MDGEQHTSTPKARQDRSLFRKVRTLPIFQDVRQVGAASALKWPTDSTGFDVAECATLWGQTLLTESIDQSFVLNGKSMRSAPTAISGFDKLRGQRCFTFHGIHSRVIYWASYDLL